MIGKQFSLKKIENTLKLLKNSKIEMEEIKTVLLGDNISGKTCILRRLIDGEYEENTDHILRATESLFKKNWKNRV